MEGKKIIEAAAKYFLPVFLLLAGIFLAVYFWRYAENHNRERAELKFNNQVIEVNDAIDAKVNRDVYLLNGYQGFFAASQDVSGEEFQIYSASLDISANYPSISTIAYEQYVSSNEAIVRYIYPKNSAGLELIGFNIFTEENRRSIGEKALISGRIQMTPLVGIFPDNKPGFAALAPVYLNGAPINTVAEKRAYIRGFIVVGVNAENFFSEILSSFKIDSQEFNLTVSDITDGNTGVFYDYSSLFGVKLGLENAGISKIIETDIGGRTWQTAYWGSSNYGLSEIEKIWPKLILLLGLLASLLFASAFFYLSGSRVRALKLAQQMTQDLRNSEAKFKAIVETAKDAIVMMDSKGKLALWSKGAERMLGYKESELLGKDFHAIIAVAKPHQTEKKNILNFGKTGESPVLDKSVELNVKSKQGKKFLVELTVARAKINNEWHAVGIMRDITERKKAEEEILARSQELERLNKLMLGRELKMIELKKSLAEKKQ